MVGNANELVFVVDDDANLRALVERWMLREGYEVLALDSGEACLEALSEDIPAAICLDLHMPGLTGLETLERVHAHNPMLPIIVLTGDDRLESAVAAMKLGACDYLT